MLLHLTNVAKTQRSAFILPVGQVTSINYANLISERNLNSLLSVFEIFFKNFNFEDIFQKLKNVTSKIRKFRILKVLKKGENNVFEKNPKTGRLDNPIISHNKILFH